MSFLRRVYRWFYVRVKGHYPIGTLVRYHPVRSHSLGIDWLVPGLKALDVGLVVGGWAKYKHPMPGNLTKGNLVLFNGETYDMDEREIEAIDET